MRTRLPALLLAACAASGCASLADQIVAPSTDTTFERLVSPADEQGLGITRGDWRTPDGVTLAYRVVPAARRGSRYEFERHASGGGSFTFHMKDDAAPTPVPVRGTVVYLSGWGESGASMLPWALVLAERGYRGVAVDLRDTGHSSRAPIGFGPREAQDVAALLMHLREESELPQPVYLFGVSYGAATALFAEQPLRGRLAGIVAMEPYANAADAIRTMVPGVRRAMANGRIARLALKVTAFRYDDAAVEHAIADLDHRLDLDLAAIDLHVPVAQSQTCTLLLHGARDNWIPVAGSRSLAHAAPQLHYVELPAEGHLTLPLRIDWLAEPVSGWFARAGHGECTDLALPSDPAGILATQ